uniref:Uncharacterized protein n=1 Tax=Cyprinodon variegatus TaxID=28743 RepID=A0A3Q2E715_CYPVA
QHQQKKEINNDFEKLRTTMNSGLSINECGGATHPDVHPGGPPLLNTNHNVNKKSAAETVMEQGPNISFYTPILTLVDISLCLHVAVGILFIFTDKETGRWNLIYQPNHIWHYITGSSFL